MPVQPLCLWPVLMSRARVAAPMRHSWTRPCAHFNCRISPCTRMTSVDSSRGISLSSQWWWPWSMQVRQKWGQHVWPVFPSYRPGLTTTHMIRFNGMQNKQNSSESSWKVCVKGGVHSLQSYIAIWKMFFHTLDLHKLLHHENFTMQSVGCTKTLCVFHSFTWQSIIKFLKFSQFTVHFYYL